MKEYESPQVEIINLAVSELLIVASHGKYGNERWKDTDDGIDTGHSDYDGDDWGDDSDDGASAGRDDYGWSEWK